MGQWHWPLPSLEAPEVWPLFCLDVVHNSVTSCRGFVYGLILGHHVGSALDVGIRAREILRYRSSAHACTGQDFFLDPVERHKPPQRNMYADDWSAYMILFFDRIELSVRTAFCSSTLLTLRVQVPK